MTRALHRRGHREPPFLTVPHAVEEKRRKIHTGDTRLRRPCLAQLRRVVQQVFLRHGRSTTSGGAKAQARPWQESSAAIPRPWTVLRVSARINAFTQLPGAILPLTYFSSLCLSSVRLFSSLLCPPRKEITFAGLLVAH